MVLVYEAKHHQKSSQTLMMFALPYSPLCNGPERSGVATLFVQRAEKLPIEAWQAKNVSIKTWLSVVYFDQLSRAAHTLKLDETLFLPVFNPIIF